jgi:hypothetical protein
VPGPFAEDRVVRVLGVDNQLVSNLSRRDKFEATGPFRYAYEAPTACGFAGDLEVLISDLRSRRRCPTATTRDHDGAAETETAVPDPGNVGRHETEPHGLGAVSVFDEDRQCLTCTVDDL